MTVKTSLGRMKYIIDYKIKKIYDNQDEISYNMKCENAYYLSWVYYD